MTDSRIRLMEAIARRRMVEVLYNGSTIRLAPHQIFERRGDLFISALNPAKNFRSEDERKLGQFKLSGLGAVELLEEPFEPLPTFEADTVPREGDTLLLST